MAVQSMINYLIQKFDETRLWHFIARNVLSHFTLRFSGYPAFDWQRLPELLKIISNAEDDADNLYAFVATDKKTLAGKLIRLVSKSKWSHSGLILSGRPFPRAFHMKGEGCLYEPIFAVLAQADDFALVRIPITDYKSFQTNLQYYLDRKSWLLYDYEQELEDSSSLLEANDVYCSELVWLVGKGCCNLQTSKVLGRNVFSPDDVYKSGKIIFEHKS